MSISPATCPRCHAAVVSTARGRPRIWCSDQCRKLASEERRAAERGVIGLDVQRVVVEKSVREIVRTPTMPAAIDMVLGNRESIHTVLAALVTSQRAEEWSRYDRKLWAPLMMESLGVV